MNEGTLRFNTSDIVFFDSDPVIPEGRFQIRL